MMSAMCFFVVLESRTFFSLSPPRYQIISFVGTKKLHTNFFQFFQQIRDLDLTLVKDAKLLNSVVGGRWSNCLFQS